MGSSGFCLVFSGKLTDLNSISLSFRQIDNLDSTDWIEGLGALQEIERILLIGKGSNLHS